MDNALSNKDKEIANIRRALESVSSRLHKEDEKLDDMDVQSIVGRTLDKLSERAQEVVALRAEVQVLKQSLAGRSKEQKFKVNNPPPPPPPVDRRKVTVSKGNKIELPATMDSVDSSEETSPPPPPPPPPPGPAASRSPFNSSKDVLSLDSLPSPVSVSPTPTPPPMFGSDVLPPPPPPPATFASNDLSPPPPPRPPASLGPTYLRLRLHHPDPRCTTEADQNNLVHG
jgi:diaphanous 1